MKRGKDEAKVVGPMFPRLHVNDANKGGPRAPPRNKMALYEQLSIPSQRYSHLVLPRNPSGSAATVPSAIQGGANERDVFSSYQLATKHQPEKQYSQCSDVSTLLTQVEQRKKSDEDDFRVPIFVHSIPNQECGTYSSDRDRGNLASKPSCVNYPSKFQKSPKMGKLESSATQEDKIQKKENSKGSAIVVVNAISNPSSLEKAGGQKKKDDLSTPRDKPTDSIDRLATGDGTEPAALCFEAQAASERHGADVLGENITASDKRNSPILVTDDPSEHQNVLHDLSNDTESHENRSCRLERGDSGVTETSGDSISRHDITPDDVVAIIGQKRFWKARRAIANQQRVFAIQVFELHRLVKVQRLLAASPHLLLDDSPYLGKSMKTLPRKRIPLNPLMKEIPNVSKEKGESDKLSQKKESSAKNIICKPPLPSTQNGASPPSVRPSSDHSPAQSINSTSWCFSQPPHGQQWLIPVMSPIEGLVYKPYHGPGFVGPAYTGCGPPAPNSGMGNFYPPAYGVPAPHPPYQLPTHPPSIPHGYFPQYGMPVMNPAAFLGSSFEQMNACSDPGIISAGNQSMPITPSHNNEACPEALNNLNVSEEMEVQASTASSPIDRMQDSRASGSMEGRNTLPLFPMSPALDAPAANAEPTEAEHPAQVIKVVPHSAISATESAARIFRSIQEERKRQDLMC